jgi:hypothetical protein
VLPACVADTDYLAAASCPSALHVKPAAIGTKAR